MRGLEGSDSAPGRSATDSRRSLTDAPGAKGMLVLVIPSLSAYEAKNLTVISTNSPPASLGARELPFARILELDRGDECPQLLRRLEDRDRAGGDFDRRAGPGITGHPGF